MASSTNVLGMDEAQVNNPTQLDELVASNPQPSRFG